MSRRLAAWSGFVAWCRVLLAMVGAPAPASAQPVPRFGINGAPCLHPRLQDELLAASPGDTIYIQPGTYHVLPTAGSDGVNIEVDVTLAPGDAACSTVSPPGEVIYRAPNGTRAFTIGVNRVVTFRGFTIEIGLGADGGLIWSDGALTLEDMVLRDGEAIGHGGCVYSEGGGLAISNSTFTNCVAGGQGGGVYVRYPVTYDGNYTAIDTTFTGCTAGEDGGGYYFEETGAGGALVLDITGAEFHQCTAGEHGGGLYVLGGTDLATVVFGSPIVDRCEAGVRGGGIAALRVGQLTLTAGTEITRSSSDGYGGGLFVGEGTSAVVQAAVIGTVAQPNHAAYGGGIAVSPDGVPASLEVYSGSIRGNNAEFGGGIYAGWIGSVVVGGVANRTESDIDLNEASVAGGGLFTGGATVELDNAAVTDNQAPQGGNLWMGGLSVVTIGGSVPLLARGTASGDGGNLYSESSGGLTWGDDLIIEGGGIFDGTAARGGNLFLWGGTHELADSPHIEGGSATIGGGSIYLTGAADLTITGGPMQIDQELPDVFGYGMGAVIEGTGPGGAIWASASTVTASNLIIHESEYPIHLRAGAAFAGTNTWIFGADGDAVTLEDPGTSFTVQSDFAACPALGLGTPEERHPDGNEYCSALQGNAGGPVLTAGAGTAVVLDRVGVRQNTGVTGRPVVLDLAATATAEIKGSLFAQNLMDIPGPTDVVALVPAGATANLSFVTLADDFLPFHYEAGAFGYVRRSVAWPVSGWPAGGTPLVVDAPLDGPCTVGAWTGTLNPVTSEGNSPFTDPIYTNTGLSPNLRLGLTSPALDKCFDPMTVDLDGLPRAEPGPQAEPGAFERQ